MPSLTARFFYGEHHGLATIFTNCLRTGICVARS